MGTRSVVAKPNGDGFIGTYVHWDGYPSGVGQALWHAHHGYFGGDVQAMIDYLVDGEQVGWSSLAGTDFSLPKGWDEIGPDTPCIVTGCGEPMWKHYRQYYADRGATPLVPDEIVQLGHSHQADHDKPKGPQSYTVRGETQVWRIESHGDDGGTEWAYVLAPHALMIFERRYGKPGSDEGHGTGMFGLGASDTESGGHWAPVAACPWDGPEPDWNTLDNGVDGGEGDE